MSNKRMLPPPLDGVEVDVHQGRALVDLWYPRHRTPNVIEIGLVDVRAADSIRVTYDFSRDGWVIMQASIFEWAVSDTVCDQDWQEVAFIQAWAREKGPPGTTE